MKTTTLFSLSLPRWHRLLQRGLCCVGLLAFPMWAGANVEQAPPPLPPLLETPAPTATLPAAWQNQVLPFQKMGAYQPIRLRGVDVAREIPFGVRLDQSVKEAKLKLQFSYSPALIFPLSHLKVQLNKETLATISLKPEQAGALVTHEIPLDPRFFVDFNQLRLQWIAHYSNGCEDPLHSSLWAEVSPQSELQLKLAPVKLPNDLALLPAPFFDRRDQSRLNLVMVLPQGQGLTEPARLQAMASVASWFGSLASYRETRVTVQADLPADQHAVVWLQDATTIGEVKLPPLQGPELRIIDHPQANGRKLLLLRGRNVAEMEQAALGLVMGQAALSGEAVGVKKVELTPPRQPYDAPNWLPTHRPVRLGELIDNPSQLQTRGFDTGYLNVNLRLPPDLLAWNSSGVPLELKYRYTPPRQMNDSLLNVQINDQLIRSYRLKPDEKTGEANRINLPIFGGETTRSEALLVPAFRVGSDNQLQFQFHLVSERQGLCASAPSDGVTAAIDPDSTIDFSGLPHFMALPDIAAFANSGFPFTRLADLAETAVILPDRPSYTDLSMFASMMAQMGKWTGFPALRVAVRTAAQRDSVKERDWLVIGAAGAQPWLEQYGQSLPLWLKQGQREVGDVNRETPFWHQWLADPADIVPDKNARLLLQGQGGLAALFGFESPLQSARSVLVVTANDEAQLPWVADALEDRARVGLMRGDLVLLREKQVASFRLNEPYYVGDLSWWMQIWFVLSRYPLLMAVAGGFSGLLIAIGMFMALKRIARQRLGE